MKFSKDNKYHYDLLIIGAGPAGITAAIYAKRANLKIAFFEKDTPGGKMVKTGFIENYPGFSKVSGPDLAISMFNQINELEVEYLYGEVFQLTKGNDNLFCLTNYDGTKYFAKAVIIATGMSERKLGIPGENEYYGRGISYCAICDAALYKDQIVAIIGGGNTALEEGLYLTDIVKKVFLVHRREGFRAEALVVQKVKSNPKIELLLNYIPIEFIGDKTKIIGLKIKNVLNFKEMVLDIKCVFPFIGFDPLSHLLNNFSGVLDKTGFVLANEKMETVIPGLFCAGDLLKKDIKQVTTAISDGAIAAINAKKYIDKQTF